MPVAQTHLSSSPIRRLVFVDHSGAPGGGQLGLGRYLAQPSQFDRMAVFIAGGEVADQVSKTPVETVVLNRDARHRRSLLIRSIPRLRALLGDIGEDSLVISNSGYASLALALTGLPRQKLVSYLRTEPTPPDSHALKRWFDSHVVYPRFDGYLANSEWTRNALPADLARRPSRVAYPLSGLSPDDSAARNPPMTNSASVRIASFSRLDRWKGLDTLLVAAEYLQAENLGRHVTVDIFGGSHDADAGYAEELRNRAATSSVSITLHGHVSNVSERMREVDIVVVPSLHPEPFGQVVAQSLSHGCVTIVSNQGGAVEQVRHGHNGLTFQAGDSRSLADALTQAVNTPGLSVALTAHAREYGGAMSDRALASAFDSAVVELTKELARA